VTKPVALYDLSFQELSELLTLWGEPRFRAEQVWGWLYRSLVDEVDQMRNLPRRLRERLAAETVLKLLEPVAEQESLSGQTRKVLFRLADGNTVESVLMLYEERRTACISSQAGCGMACTFCATGQGGLARNLTSGEIVAQVLYFARGLRAAEIERATAARDYALLQEQHVTNVVFMGMGEPLANYDATWKAVETLSDERGYNLGARRITLSTVGLVPGIRRLAGEGLPVNLAVSLHAADDELRNRLVPVNRRYPLAELLPAVREYAAKTGRRLTIEYALIDGVNDSVEQARRLAALLADLLCHVNLIPLNPTPGVALQPSPRAKVDAFRNELERAGIAATVRMRRGIDIEAGCGQLRRREAGEGPR
jgi:23S rRNA (adenine2503-C2)-methyltransferase